MLFYEYFLKLVKFNIEIFYTIHVPSFMICLNFKVYCMGAQSYLLLKMCTAYADFWLFVFVYLWCSRKLIFTVHFGLHIIYHVLHLKLQISLAKFLFSISFWSAIRMNGILNDWMAMRRLMYLNMLITFIIKGQWDWNIIHVCVSQL